MQHNILMNMSFIIAIDTSLYVFTCFSNSCTIYAAFVQKLISRILIMIGGAHDSVAVMRVCSTCQRSVVQI